MHNPINDLTEQIIGGAICVHKALGPGMLESAYEVCLAYELLKRHLSFERQKAMPVTYRDQTMECGYRVDLLVEGAVIVEVKAVNHLERIHHAQVLSYLRLSGYKVGLLFNFNVKCLATDGIRRIVNGFPE